MLSAQQFHIKGRHHTLVPSTSLEAQRGELLLVQADGQERRTALALGLSGRMRPTSGSVALGHEDSLKSLRKKSAIVDAPEVNEPENHLTVRSLVAEDLAMVPFKFRDRTRPTAWLVKKGFRDILGLWVEELDPARRLQLQVELALADGNIELLVIDSPDRHSNDPAMWLPYLQEVVQGRVGLPEGAHAGSAARELIVVAVVSDIPDSWEGPTAAVGSQPQLTRPDAEPAEPAQDEPPAAEEELAEESIEAAAAQESAESAESIESTEASSEDSEDTESAEPAAAQEPTVPTPSVPSKTTPTLESQEEK